MQRILFWLKNSRLFSLPMTFMSWLVVFLYSLKFDGNILNGFLALIGIAFAHLATNLFDDYVDYKKLSKEDSFINNNEKSKCSYIKTGEATLWELLKVVIVYCSIAFMTGVYLTLACGWGVFILALIGGIIVLTYAKLSSNGLSELAVGTAFGPLLFEGVFYVMCGRFSLTVLLLSFVVVAFTVGLVYMNNLLDYDSDVLSGKKSLCIRLGNKERAAFGILVIYFIGYISSVILALHLKHPIYCLPVLTSPLAFEVYNSVKKFYFNNDAHIKIKWWYNPLDNWEKIKQNGCEKFYLRLFLARNIMIWVSTLMIIAIIISYAK